MSGAGATGPARPPSENKGKSREDGSSETLQSEWIDRMGREKADNAMSTALTRRADAQHMPGHEYDRNSSLPLALQLKRRQLDKTAKPETYHPRWKLSRVIAGHLGWVRTIAVEPGNQWFATGAGDRMIKVCACVGARVHLT